MRDAAASSWRITAGMAVLASGTERLTPPAVDGDRPLDDAVEMACSRARPTLTGGLGELEHDRVGADAALQLGR